MKRKIAVSVPEELVDFAQHEVRNGRAASLSAYVSQALADKARGDELGEMLDQWEREFGPPRKADLRWARRVLGLSSSTPQRSSK